MPAAERTVQISGSTVIVRPTAEAASRVAADAIADIIQSAVTARQGRARAGHRRDPEVVYASLAARHKAGGLSFQKVVTYNLDEYYPIQPLDPRSYRPICTGTCSAGSISPPNQATS